MSYKAQIALVFQTRAGRNINIDICSCFDLNTSVEIGSALMYSYCVEYLLTRLF